MKVIVGAGEIITLVEIHLTLETMVDQMNNLLEGGIIIDQALGIEVIEVMIDIIAIMIEGMKGDVLATNIKNRDYMGGSRSSSSVKAFRYPERGQARTHNRNPTRKRLECHQDLHVEIKMGVTDGDSLDI